MHYGMHGENWSQMVAAKGPFTSEERINCWLLSFVYNGSMVPGQGAPWQCHDKTPETCATSCPSAQCWPCAVAAGCRKLQPCLYTNNASVMDHDNPQDIG